jgi:hypothetical protein
VFFVRLAGLRDPALVASAIATEAGVESLQALGSRRALLLVDNFEHVISAAGDIAELLAAGQEARVLVTSRSPLRVAGEVEYRVEPLSERSAVVLFAERGRAVQREVALDETARAICERLDNLPLAIELAAARLRTLDPETLLERLEVRLPLLTHGARDAPARQQTLAATIAWSYELLPADSQVLFQRLSVFAGTFSLAAAEEVCGASLDSIESLVELSLLKALARGRFLLLNTVREFAPVKARKQLISKNDMPATSSASPAGRERHSTPSHSNSLASSSGSRLTSTTCASRLPGELKTNHFPPRKPAPPFRRTGTTAAELRKPSASSSPSRSPTWRPALGSGCSALCHGCGGATAT